MIKSWIHMKKNEWRVKEAFYGIIASIMDNQKEIVEVSKKLFVSLKDVPVEKIQEDLIEKIAEFVHEENKKENSTKK